MTEWGVVLVLISLAGLIGAVVAPLIKLNTSITTLTVTMTSTADSLKELTQKNTESHRRIHGEIDEQGEKIADHEVRITVLEGRNK